MSCDFAISQHSKTKFCCRKDKCVTVKGGLLVAYFDLSELTESCCFEEKKKRMASTGIRNGAELMNMSVT